MAGLSARLSIISRIAVPVSLLLLATGCATIQSPLELPDPEPGVSALFLISHGYGNNPSHWPARLIGRIRDAGAADGWQLYAHDWSANSLRALSASRVGYRIGRHFGREIAQQDQYATIHLLGHSLGAFVMQGLVDAYRDAGGGASIQMTFLDPFLLRGWFGVGWGVRSFGRGADFAESYVVIGDRVRATNRYLRRAHNFDITGIVPEAMWEDRWGAHWWGVEFYRQSVGAVHPGFSLSPSVTDGASVRPSHDGFPRGGVTPLSRRIDGSVDW
jgi:hypothetical protein